VSLTPTYETKAEALASVHALWRDCGANVSTMQAEQHDAIFAAVSHLPHLLAFALVDDIASRNNADQLFRFAASGLEILRALRAATPKCGATLAWPIKPHY
jgi:prephenate dehydrogenase